MIYHLLSCIIITPLLYILLRNTSSSNTTNNTNSLSILKKYTQVDESDLSLILDSLFKYFPEYRDFITSIREVLISQTYKEYEVRFLIYYISRVGGRYVTDEVREKCREISEGRERVEGMECSRMEMGLVSMMIAYNEKKKIEM